MRVSGKKGVATTMQYVPFSSVPAEFDASVDSTDTLVSALPDLPVTSAAAADTAPAPAFMSITTETRVEYLLRTRQATPRFLQGVYPFAGRSVFELAPLHDELRYTVPNGKTAQVMYFRAGNLSDDLLYLTLGANGQPVRYFPVGPKSDFHVPLVIVEDYPAGTRLEVCIAAPRGLTGSVVVDVGIIEMDAAASAGSVMSGGRA